MVHGRQISIEETLAGISAVSLDDCRSIADEFFRPERLAFAALGDLADAAISRADLSF
jgi:predicted Zn-dependent peptidase